MLQTSNVTKLNFVLFPSKCVLLNLPSVVDCLDGKWTDCVTEC